MDLDKTIKKRTSIKNYSDKKPKDDKIINAIEAASLAPSPGPLGGRILSDERKNIAVPNKCGKTAPVRLGFPVTCSSRLPEPHSNEWWQTNHAA